MEIDPSAIRQRIAVLEAAGQRQWDIARANSRSFDPVYGSCAEADFARAAELRHLIGLPTRAGEAERVVEKFNLVNERAMTVHIDGPTVAERVPELEGSHEMLLLAIDRAPIPRAMIDLRRCYVTELVEADGCYRAAVIAP